MTPSNFATWISAGMFVLVTVALAQSRTQAVSVNCGDNLWNMTVAATVMHSILIPCIIMCIVMPIAMQEPSFVESSKQVFKGLIGFTIVLLVTVFGLEVGFTAEAMANPKCVDALKNATGSAVPLLPVANIIFSIYDGIMLFVLFVSLANVDRIFDLFAPDIYVPATLPPDEQQPQQGGFQDMQQLPAPQAYPVRGYLAVAIDRI